MLSTRELLNQFLLPEHILFGSEKVRPTDLTRRAVVLWLKYNLPFGNENNPALHPTLKALDNLLGLKWSR